MNSEDLATTGSTRNHTLRIGLGARCLFLDDDGSRRGRDGRVDENLLGEGLGDVLPYLPDPRVFLVLCHEFRSRQSFFDLLGLFIGISQRFDCRLLGHKPRSNSSTSSDARQRYVHVECSASALNAGGQILVLLSLRLLLFVGSLSM